MVTFFRKVIIKFVAGVLGIGAIDVPLVGDWDWVGDVIETLEAHSSRLV